MQSLKSQQTTEADILQEILDDYSIHKQSAKGGNQESKCKKGRKTISGGKDFIKIKVSDFKL